MISRAGESPLLRVLLSALWKESNSLTLDLHSVAGACAASVTRGGQPALESPGRQGKSCHFPYSPVSIGNSNASHRAIITAQEKEGDIASRRHQVDEHGHSDGPQGRQAELLYQEATQEDAQAGARDGCHPWKESRWRAMSGKERLIPTIPRPNTECPQ